MVQHISETYIKTALPQKTAIAVSAASLDKCAAEVSQVDVILKEAQEYVARQKAANDAALHAEMTDAEQNVQNARAAIKNAKDHELTIAREEVTEAHNLAIEKKTETANLAKQNAVALAKDTITKQSNSRVSNFKSTAEHKRKDAVEAMVRAAAPVETPIGLVPIDIDGNGVQDTTDAVTLFIAQTMQGYGAGMLLQQYWKEHPHETAKRASLAHILQSVDKAVSELEAQP